ncbi:hypothetical protein PIB30_072906 [Stylosanthes scabra]|uniref:Uncharacterized protein n=1 Tax=Stylosanthes scabra TaxID=79078 RepID=A0ABU6QRE9_9FABA|nr:hypothetical protein [Stylosanthes scabra]
MRNLETQAGQIAKQLSTTLPNNFPSNTEDNPKGECKAITLRSGRAPEDVDAWASLIWTEALRFTWRRPRITWSESMSYVKPTYKNSSSPSTPLQPKINLLSNPSLIKGMIERIKRRLIED